MYLRWEENHQYSALAWNHLEDGEGDRVFEEVPEV
jgi:hypothetical protein